MLINVRLIVLSFVLGLAASPGILAGSELTPSAGFRFGGEVSPSAVQQRTIDESLSYGLTYDIPLAPEKWVSILWSHQSSEVDLPGFLPGDDTFDLTVDYLLAGTAYRPMVKKRFRPFVMAAVGITWVDPQQSEFDSDLVASGMLGGGAKFPINEQLSFRIEGRGYLNFEEATLSGSCGGVGCSVHFAADGAIQFEGLAGLTIAF